jgi:tRNA 5-methylaminomethyl-2-thiouridine biosynthesis bifunctional protein
MQAIARLRIFYPLAGVVRPRRVLQAMLKEARLHVSTAVKALERTRHGWRLIGENGATLSEYENVVIANGASLGQFEQTQWLPLEWSRGQIEWGGTRAPRHAISGDGYVLACDGGVLFGASHERVGHNADLDISLDVQSENRKRLHNLDGALAQALAGETLRSRVQLRTATPDRMAIAGLAPNAPAWLSHYGDALRKGRALPAGPAQAHDGMFIFGALGSRGFTMAPLLAERLASEICGEAAPITRLMLDVIHPARYLIRAAKRGLSVTS